MESTLPIIRQLPTSVINKIAAGEVIERPASVVKELVENSVDAGSTKIDVHIEKGGTELIRISDNGCGIPDEQLELAVTSHATSKISNADELFSVSTMGFRGEALASIAEVTQFLIRSRTHDSPCGNELAVNGGQREPIAPCGCAVGTVMEVRNLFFNTPVRRKFLKTPQTEMGHISDAFTRIALANPHVHFTLSHNKRTLHDLPPTEDWSQRIGAFFGEEIQRNLIEVDSEHGEITLAGYVVNPNISRSNNRMQFLFLNNRFIRDRALQHALSEAYRGLLMTGRFPIAFLRMAMPADQVDVNVHPAKLEVRFQESGRLYSQLLGTLRSKFLDVDLRAKIGLADSEDESSVERGDSAISGQLVQEKAAEVQAWAKGSTGDAASQQLESAAQTIFPVDQSPAPSADWTSGGQGGSGSSGNRAGNHSYSGGSSGRGAFASLPSANEFKKFPSLPGEIGISGSSSDSFLPPSGYVGQGVVPGPEGGVESQGELESNGAEHLGEGTIQREDSAPIPVSSRPASGRLNVVQILNRYLVLESEGGMMVIDQHALHERILYEQFRERILSGSVLQQKLLVPIPIELPSGEAGAVLEIKDHLKKIGIGVDDFGGETVLLTSYPSIMAKSQLKEIVHYISDQLSQGSQKPDLHGLLDHLMATMACKAAIKAGDRLTQQEMDSLIEYSHLCQDAHHCPHGRPSSLIFSRDELDKRFKRI